MQEKKHKDKKGHINEMVGSYSREQKLKSIQPILEFNQTPRGIKAYLDRYIIGQEEGKKVMATSIAFHYKRLGNGIKRELKENDGDLDAALKNTRNAKANIMLIGPSGCGKTYTAEVASDLIKVPFVKFDMTKFSETGYVGKDLSDILLDLFVSSDYDPYLAQMGFVYLDEMDKIRNASFCGRDVSGQGVQNGLLKLVEGIDNCIDMGNHKITLSTKHVLFIASGAYEGIGDSVKKRMKRQNIKVNGNWKDYISTADLVEYGMERQLIGRFPVMVAYDQLNREQIEQIMTGTENSPLHAYTDDFKDWGINLKFDETALNEVAKFAEKEGIGARGLTRILNKVLLDHMYLLSGNEKGDLAVTKNYVMERLSQK